jgi:ankyrin repeat protein
MFMGHAGMRISKSKASFSFGLSVIVASLLLYPACSSPAGKAKAGLARRGLEFSENAFLDQVKAGEAETVRLFLAAGMSPDTGDRGYAALVEAARRGHERIALELIEAGARVDAKDPYGVTALMFSLITGSGAAATALMEKGADVKALDVDGRTALIEALATENDIPTEVFRTLIGKGADVNVRIAGGITPLMIAVNYDPAIVRMLVEAGADVNARDENGASVLRMAKDIPENVKILKDAGAVE